MSSDPSSRVTLQTARLTGKVQDLNQAAIPKVSVCITGANGIWKVVSDMSGVYSIDLPNGTYTITTSVSGFQRLVRAPFTLLPQTEAIINLTLWASEGASHSSFRPPQFQYERVPLQMASSELLIQFTSANRLGETTNYGLVIITADQLTLRADQAVFDRVKSSITLEGNVTIEDGKTTRGAHHARVDLTRDGIVVKVIKGSIVGVRGQGSIDKNNIDFDFNITADKTGYFKYRDKKEGIELVSTEIDSLSTVNHGQNLLKFSGLGAVNGMPAVRFTVVVGHDESGATADRLSIKFIGYTRADALTQGKISVTRE